MSDLLDQLRAQLSGASTQPFSDEQLYCLSLLLREMPASPSVPLALSVISSPHLILTDLPPISSNAPPVAVEEPPLVLGALSASPKLSPAAPVLGGVPPVLPVPSELPYVSLEAGVVPPTLPAPATPPSLSIGSMVYNPVSGTSSLYCSPRISRS